VHQLFIDFKNAYDSLRREVLYYILLNIRTTKKLIILRYTCLTETCIRVRVDKNLSDIFLIRNCLKHVDGLAPFLLNFALKYAIRRVQVNQDGLKLNGTLHRLPYAMMLIYWGESYILERKMKQL
jgi:hypothetical protein